MSTVMKSLKRKFVKNSHGDGDSDDGSHNISECKLANAFIFPLSFQHFPY